MQNIDAGIGKQSKAQPSSINNIGKPIGAASREAGNVMLKEIGVEDAGDRFDCVRIVAAQLERDKPHEAMEKAMEYIDTTGAYRLFAELLVNR